MVYSFGFKVSGLKFRVYSFGFMVSSLWFRVYGFGFMVSGLTTNHKAKSSKH